MATIGLLGNEFDKCLRLLKVRIEDLGHTARVINLTHLPRVTRATLQFDSLVYDGYDLFEMGSFYLRDMGIRDPFFHVSYARELWAVLRERYLAFVETEINNIAFTCSILEILASRVPVVNPPRAYAHRTMVPFHLNALAFEGLRVPAFVTARAEAEPVSSRQDQLPLNLDWEKAWDVLSFPKGREKGLQVLRERKTGTIYKLIIIEDKLINRGLATGPGGVDSSQVRLEELPREVSEAALEAARTVDLTFGEITLQYSEEDRQVWVLQVDPSPDFQALEDVGKLEVSEPLARHLIGLAAKH